MKTRWRLGFLAAIVWLVMPASAEAADATNVVAFRQAVMQLLDGHVDAIEDVVQGTVDFTDHVAGHAVSIEQLSTQLEALFPVATGPDDDVATNALQDIWADDAGFAASAQMLQQAAAALAAAALSDDQLAVVTRFNDLRRNGCDACHASFRRRPSQ